MDSECQAVLEGLCGMLSTDIAAVEAMHSSNRELTMMRSRGWYCSLPTLCSKFIFHVIHRMSAFFDSDKGSGSSSTKPEPGSEEKRHGGGGGGWRAFVHDKAKGTRMDPTQLSKEYNALPPDVKQLYADAGAKGTIAHRHGFSSFGSASASLPVPRIADKPQPGEIHEGAVIGQDLSVTDAELLEYTGPDFFMDKYKKLKQEVNTKRKSSQERVSTEEMKELHSFELEGERDKLLEH